MSNQCCQTVYTFRVFFPRGECDFLTTTVTGSHNLCWGSSLSGELQHNLYLIFFHYSGWALRFISATPSFVPVPLSHLRLNVYGRDMLKEGGGLSLKFHIT